ncbi:MAG: DUF3341 domain-containing protein [Isosphaeraceae bacterium]
MTAKPRIHGLLAEFADPDDLVGAARAAHEAGYRKMDAYSPLPIDGLAEAIGFQRNGLPALVLAGGVVGATIAYAMMYYTAVYDYPFNIGGRPFHSAPAFVPITFELTILFASLAAVLGMLGLNGLPMPYHPVFNAPGFAMASRSRFFLCIEAADPLFDETRTRTFLEGLGPRSVVEVEP